MTVPMALSDDTNILMNLAIENNGFISYSLCYEKLSLNRQRFENIIVKIKLK
jgi:hypothetical protein